jgi:stearoyl-CoA desaturase (delta-9 desaturase)
MWLHRFELAPAVALAVFCYLVAGWSGLVVGFFCSTALVYHATFCINSLAHVRGRKRYVTGDDSRNNWLLAIFTMGEGWHNNHHAYQSSVRQGFRWWEIDPTYYLLRMLSWIGLVWDLKMPPPQVLRNEHRLGSRVINRAAEQLIASINPERIVLAVTASLHGPELSALQQKLAIAQHRAKEVLASMHLPQLPTRDELAAKAKVLFAVTGSLDEIVDRAYEYLLVSVSERLALLGGAASAET